MKVGKLSEEDQAKISTLLTLGLKQKDVAARFQVTRNTVWKIARRAGIRKYNMDPLSPEMEERGIALLREGHGEPYIMRTLAISRTRCRQLSQKYLLAQTGSREGRERLSELEERAVRTKFRAFEKQMADEHGVKLDVIERLLRRRK